MERVDWGMTLARPTLSQLRLFLAVAQAGGFSEAAADLGMSQSSLSEGVAGLERALGVRLFRRGPSGVTLTAAGARATEHAVRAVQAAEDLTRAVQDSGSLKGLLRIAAPRSVATHLLPPVLADFRYRHPGVQFQIVDADHSLTNTQGKASGEALLLAGEADLGILHLPISGPLLTWPFYSDDYVLVVPERQDRAVPSGPARWSDITDHPLMLPASGDNCNLLVHAYLREHGQVLPPVIEVENDSVTLGMVAHGLGHAILPRLAVLPLPPGLRTLALPVTLQRELHVAVLPARASLPIIAAMTSSLRQSVAQSPVAEPPLAALPRNPESGTHDAGPAA